MRFLSEFGAGTFASGRYETVPEWLLVRACRVETDGSGPKRNCGAVPQIPGFQVQMPSNVVRVPCIAAVVVVPIAIKFLLLLLQ